jgi:LPXTG cell wall surface protein
MYIEYSTKVAPGTKVGDLVHNTLTWKATNFPEPRSLTREVRLESGSGEGLGEKDQTPPTSSSTTTPESTTTPSSPSSSTTSKPSDPTTTESNDIPKTGKKKVLPSTGEKMMPVIILVGILGCAVGFTVLRSKKLTK